MNNKRYPKNLTVGGQAVLEGVMIRSPNYLVTSVRKKNKIISKKGPFRQRKSKFLKLPFIRGFVNLVDMLVIGIKSLSWSAEQLSDEEEKFGKYEIAVSLALASLFVILFFIGLPYLLATLIGVKEETRPILFNLVDGIIRISLFLTYVIAISFMKDIARVFQYHGAEHKAVNCYEAGKELTIPNIKKYSTLHLRCGTSFLMFVFAVSILFFSILPSVVMFAYPKFILLSALKRKLILFPLRILFIPIIAGVSYEILKKSDKFKSKTAVKIISSPGLLLQKLTVREPDKKQIEVAIMSLTSALWLENRKLYKVRKKKP